MKIRVSYRLDIHSRILISQNKTERVSNRIPLFTKGGSRARHKYRITAYFRGKMRVSTIENISGIQLNADHRIPTLDQDQEIRTLLSMYANRNRKLATDETTANIVCSESLSRNDAFYNVDIPAPQKFNRRRNGISRNQPFPKFHAADEFQVEGWRIATAQTYNNSSTQPVQQTSAPTSVNVGNLTCVVKDQSCQDT